jgi:hypothetical protein
MSAAGLEADELEALAADPLGTIAATGGLASCYDEDRRRHLLAQQALRMDAKEGEGSALQAALREADARKVLVKHPDARSSMLGPGPESVPRSTVRPQRAVRPQPDVGGLEHIRDNTFPPQPQLMALPSTGEGYQLDDGSIVVYEPPAASNAVALRHAETSVMPTYEVRSPPPPSEVKN